MTATILARLGPEAAQRALAMAALRLAVETRTSDVHAWRATALPQQLPPEDDWRVLYIRGGRGSGKTHAGSHILAEMAVEAPGDYAVIAPTFADMRDKCIEGPSGLLAALGTSRPEVERGAARHVEAWNRTHGELRLRNGAVIHGDGADDGAPTVQGFNLRGAWADEVALWRRWRPAWEESLRYAVRLAPARIIATGTPKRGHPLVRLLLADPAVATRLLRTLDNAAHLDPRVVEGWMSQYGGTALGRQELEGEVLDDVPGAAWQRDWIELYRLSVAPPLDRATVGVDPAITTSEGSDATGIVAAGAVIVTPEWCKQMFANIGVTIVPDSHGTKLHEHYFVLEDASAKATPSEWGHRAVAIYRRLAAGRIVGETNRGGEMVEHTMRTVDPDVSFKPVRATRGKVTRAEPVAALYEQGKVHHIGFFPGLEDEMTSYVPGDSASPDRMDALVWALTDLAIKDEPGLLGMYRGQAAQKNKEAA